MEIINRNQFIWLESDIFIFPFLLLLFFMFPLIIKPSWDESEEKNRLEKLFAVCVFQFDSFFYLLSWIKVKRCSSFSKFSMSVFLFHPTKKLQFIQLIFSIHFKEVRFVKNLSKKIFSWLLDKAFCRNYFSSYYFNWNKYAVL